MQSPDGQMLRFIFGVKLKQFRQERELTLKELANRTGLSVSYLSEIENGRKYPKPEKLSLLARALDKPFDDLVTIGSRDDLSPLSSLLTSPVIRDFPLHLFGIAPQDLLDIFTDAPKKADALLRTLTEITRAYDMRVEHFLLAALRSYQILHLNYFKDLEEAAAALRLQHGWQTAGANLGGDIRQILESDYNHRIIETNFDEAEELAGFRSILIDGDAPRLFINKRLMDAQKAFVLGRELGYCHLSLPERTTTSSWVKIKSFEQVLNNFKASYFAGALLLERDALVSSLRALFAADRWNPEGFLDIMRAQASTPEMFMYRLSQLIPHFFDLRDMHYLRFSHDAGTGKFVFSKELNMARALPPHGVLGRQEHYCRRWLAIRLLKQAAASGATDWPLVAAQRARFLQTDETFFTITLARPLALQSTRYSSISLGFLITDSFKSRVRFWDDPDVPSVEVNETCERCALPAGACDVRAAEPTLYQAESKQQRTEDVVARFIREHSPT